MALSVIFLLTSIVTARLLEKKKMRVASVAYTVMFIIMALVLLFTADAESIRNIMLRVVGSRWYFDIRHTFLDAIRAPLYGVYMMSAILLTFAIQLSVTVIFTAKAVVYHLTKHRAFEYTIKKVHNRLLHEVCSLKMSRNVNLLYCRMLN